MAHKRSSTDNKAYSQILTSSSNGLSEEAAIQKHVKFWDKKNQGYITPLDTISGFITLGYSVLFSIAIGAFVGVFLSISTQTGWFPDPLCRSSVRNLISTRKDTQTNTGAFDENGVFVPEKFDSLFNKYAKSDESGRTITLTEFVSMTKEQERLGKNVKAWATSIIELCAAYFFIGHRGKLSREDVRAAYDGTMFYHLKESRLLIKDKRSHKSSNSSLKVLSGSYLTPENLLSIRGIEHRVNLLLDAVQSKSYKVIEDTRLGEWMLYAQESANNARSSPYIPSGLRRSPSIIQGVTTPKTSVYRNTSKKGNETIENDAEPDITPDSLTGVAKPYSSSFKDGEQSSLTGLLLGSNQTAAEGSMGLHQPISFQSLASDSRKDATFSTTAYPLPKESVSTSSESSQPLMSSFLRQDDYDWPSSSLLTGVQGSSKQHKSELLSNSSNDIGIDNGDSTDVFKENGDSHENPILIDRSANSVKSFDSHSDVFHESNINQPTPSSSFSTPTKQKPPTPPPNHNKKQVQFNASFFTDESSVEVPQKIITPPPENKVSEHSTAVSSISDKSPVPSNSKSNNVPINHKKNGSGSQISNKKVKNKHKKNELQYASENTSMEKGLHSSNIVASALKVSADL